MRRMRGRRRRRAHACGTHKLDAVVIAVGREHGAGEQVALLRVQGGDALSDRHCASTASTREAGGARASETEAQVSRRPARASAHSAWNRLR
jgi:hypothetical protein